MFDQQHRNAALDALEHLHHAGRILRPHAGHRLVEQQQFRVGGQCHGDFELAVLAMAQHAGGHLRASGENANHSASLPTVGTYLDEMPITTIQGALDIHAYDLARVEALAGPQGTLYGASSMAGTIKLVTNRPDTRDRKSTRLNSSH